MNTHGKHIHITLSPTVHIAHQSSMHRQTPTIHIPSQSGVNICTIESIPMPYCIDSLAMRIVTMNRFWLSISHCAPWVFHQRMQDTSGIPLIYMNCNYIPSGQLYSDSMQLHHMVCVTTAETEGTCNHMDRSGIWKRHHHKCDKKAKCNNFGFHPIRRNL